MLLSLMNRIACLPRENNKGFFRELVIESIQGHLDGNLSCVHTWCLSTSAWAPAQNGAVLKQNPVERNFSVYLFKDEQIEAAYLLWLERHCCNWANWL